MYLQGVSFDFIWFDQRSVRYCDVWRCVPSNEVEQSTYNFEYAPVRNLELFDFYEAEATRLIEAETAITCL